jgi:hypothetical protein
MGVLRCERWVQARIARFAESRFEIAERRDRMRSLARRAVADHGQDVGLEVAALGDGALHDVDRVEQHAPIGAEARSRGGGARRQQLSRRAWRRRRSSVLELGVEDALQRARVARKV